MMEKSLDGLRVLVIEDEPIIAMLIEDMLADLGCIVIGVASRFEEAMGQVSSPTFDAAILDVNLGGDQTYPIAAALAERGIPFAFSTGYGAAGVPEAFQIFPILAKPFRRSDLEQTLAAALNGRLQAPT